MKTTSALVFIASVPSLFNLVHGQAIFDSGLSVDAGGTVDFYSWANHGGVDGGIGTEQGAFWIYSSVAANEPISPGDPSGGIHLVGQPITLSLGDLNSSTDGQFSIYSMGQYYSGNPLFEIDSVAMTAAFDGLSVSIDGSQVLTESSLALELPGALHNLPSIEFWGSAATGDGSFAGGAASTASGPDSFAMGAGSVATGDRSFAIGGGDALGNYSIAHGVASAEGTFGFGSGTFGTYAKAAGGWARGVMVKVETDAWWATGFGLFNTITGEASFSAGRQLLVNSPCSSVFGTGNIDHPVLATAAYELRPEDVLFQVGNGDLSGSQRSDAVMTTKGGVTRLTNKSWSEAAPLDETTPAYGNGQALVVDGHTTLRGRVIIEEPQGDISMGIFE